MANNRCSECNKFVSTEICREPEVEDIEIEDLGENKAKLTFTLNITKVCVECGNEISTGQIDIETEIKLSDVEFEPV